MPAVDAFEAAAAWRTYALRHWHASPGRADQPLTRRGAQRRRRGRGSHSRLHRQPPPVSWLSRLLTAR